MNELDLNFIQTILAWYLIGINAITFLLFGFDKWMARVQTRRIPEKTLLFYACIGGSIGAVVGMQTFRHKTRKSSFLLSIGAIVLLQAVSIAVPVLSGWVEL